MIFCFLCALLGRWFFGLFLSALFLLPLNQLENKCGLETKDFAGGKQDSEWQGVFEELHASITTLWLQLQSCHFAFVCKEQHFPHF